MANNLNINEGVSCIVPTFRRPEGLKIALESLQRQSAGGLPIEIIVADNDPAGSAKEYVKAFAKTAVIRTYYLHVPDPGVSNARNAALAAAKGRYLAFLDDDQEAGENWLETLLRISNKYEAALSFVPTIARIPGESIYNDYYVKFFSRFGPKMEEGVLKKFFGCGNSLLDLSRCALPVPAFSLEMNESGGEDDLLFSYLQDQGIKMAWSKAAVAYEDIRPHRATPEYIRVRSFAFGQGPVQMAAEREGFTLPSIIRWMLIGTLQYIVNRPMQAITGLIGHTSYMHYLNRAAQGAGKVLWTDKFRPKLYGAAVVGNTAF